MKQRLSACFILAGFILTLILVASLATQADEGRLALKGYDPVAYFTDKRAMVGDAQFRYEWDGAIYHFASAKHLELFKAEPERYLPQYNQWCAASVAKGVKVYGNPEWWLVVDDRLYLFGKPIGPEQVGALVVRRRQHARPHQPELRKPLASHGRFLALCQLLPSADITP